MSRATRKLTMPANVLSEREYTVVFVMGDCSCQNCERRKTILASSRVEAISKLQQLCFLAWVLRVE